MRDIDKTKEQLINELVEMRQLVTKLDALEAQRKPVGRVLQPQTFEGKYMTLIEEAPIGICHVDLKGKVTYVNRRFEEVSGYSRREIVGKNGFKLGVFSRETLKHFAQRMKDRLMGKPAQRLETKFKCKDGKWIWVEIEGRILRERGVPVCFQLVSRDVSERRQAEEALRESEAQLKTTLASIYTGIIVIDAEKHQIVDANALAVKMIGAPKEQIIGAVCHRYICPAEEGHCPITDLGLTVDNSECVLLNANGENVPILKSVVPVMLGGRKHLVESFINITERKRAEEALRESEERFRSIVENSHEGIHILDDAYRYIYVNDEMCRIRGYSRAELIGHDFREFLDEESKQFFVDRHMRIQRGEEVPSRYQFNIIRKDGEKRTVEVSASKVKDSAGKVRTIVQVLDVTERKQAEEALRQSQEALRKILESVTDGISVIDLNGVITEVNQRTVEMHGFGSKDELLGKNAIELVAPRDHERIAINMQQALKQGKTISGVEYTLLKVDGSEFPGELGTSVLKDASGNSVGHITIARDITERKQAEEALKESEAKYRTLFEDSRDAFFITTRDGRVVDVNQSFLELFGYTRKEAIGLDVRQMYFNPDDRHRFQQQIEQKGEVRDYELKLYNRDGGELTCLLNATVRRTNGGDILGYHGFIHDITERRLIEQREEEMQQELILSSRLASIGEMASGIAHEINNPLTAVIGYAQLLGQRDVPEDIKEVVGVINEGAQRVAEIVQKLLTFARGTKAEKEPVDINSVLTSVLEMRSYEMYANNIEVKSELVSDLPLTVANLGQLQQVFLNIVMNAEQAMMEAHDRGKLSIKTERINNSIRVSIADDGPGIAKEDIGKIFNPFFTGRDRGTGLGLSIAYSIVKAHKGRIHAKSTLGKGSTFIVELPIVVEPKQLEMAEPADEKPEGVAKARIMVVDDEPSICQFLNRFLTGEGHKVQTVLNVEAALQKMNAAKYDLVLLDIKMPGMSGIELYEHMKEVDPALQQKVVFIAGEVNSSKVKAFLSKTRVPCLTKPFNLEQLKKELNHKLYQAVKS
ncbi:MAG: PAS domain S-box protein [Dehalococcoidia bacterium]|nr:PAS domain S-box protein [Dehalococcoidia bacterium]